MQKSKDKRGHTLLSVAIALTFIVSAAAAITSAYGNDNGTADDAYLGAAPDFNWVRTYDDTNYGNYSSFSTVVAVEGGGFVTIGLSPEGDKDASIMTFNYDGNDFTDKQVKFGKADSGLEYNTFHSVAAFDGGFAAVGQAYDDPNESIYAIIVIFDSGLNMLCYDILAYEVDSTFFTSVVAVDGGFAAVGFAYDDDEYDWGCGLIVMYEYDGAEDLSVKETALLESDFDGSYFTSVIAVDGGFVAVGCSYSPDGGEGEIESGLIAMFEYDGDGFGDQDHASFITESLFSSVIAVDGGFVAVGALSDGSNCHGVIVMFSSDLDSNNYVYFENGTLSSRFYSVIETDGGFAAAGDSWSAVSHPKGIIVMFGYDDDNGFSETWNTAYTYSEDLSVTFYAAADSGDGFFAVGCLYGTDIDCGIIVLFGPDNGAVSGPGEPENNNRLFLIVAAVATIGVISVAAVWFFVFKP